MKKVILISFVCILSYTQLSAQKISGRVTYVATVRNRLFLQNVPDKVDTTRLYFSDTASAYVIEQNSLKLSPSDSLKMQGMDPSTRDLLISTVKRAQSFYQQRFNYHSAGTNTMSGQWLSHSGKGYCLIDTIPEFGWELMPDTMRILGFLCYKATCKSGVLGSAMREYVAWYTPDIPVPYGPGNFFGLPGLILSVDTKYYNFIAAAIKLPLLPEEIIKVNRCSNLPTITRKEADQINRKDNEDLQNIRSLRNN